jgi:hypothetical protein
MLKFTGHGLQILIGRQKWRQNSLIAQRLRIIVAQNWIAA